MALDLLESWLTKQHPPRTVVGGLRGVALVIAAVSGLACGNDPMRRSAGSNGRDSGSARDASVPEDDADSTHAHTDASVEGEASSAGLIGDEGLFGATPETDSFGVSRKVATCSSEVIDPSAQQPAACQPGEKCAVAGFTETSGELEAITGIPIGCIDANMDGTTDGTCEFVFGCAPAGMARTGEACFIDMQTGADNCEPGDSCEAMSGHGPTARHMCMEFCAPGDGDASCAHLATEKAMPASSTHCHRGGFHRASNVSACTVPCQLGGNACTAPGTGCKLVISEHEFMCWGVGTVAVGASCIGLGTEDCVGEASCAHDNPVDPNSPSFCREACSAAKACPRNFVCRPVEGTRDGGGTCQPK